MKELPKDYDPKASEERWMRFWEDETVFRFNTEDENIFSIDTPPPTISGKMHMGHAFGASQQDFIARYKRMRGFNVLQPFGTDDNGLPTKLLIEKLKGVKASKMGRDAFIKLCLDTLEKELRPGFIHDWKRLGISCDFNVYYTTISEYCRKISQKSFIDLYNMKRAYRKEAPAMWCPKCETAISQVELEDKEFKTFFNDIIFMAEGKELIISTTRPELLPACVSVFYHPDDKRYKDLNGKKAKVPIFNFEVPIMEDSKVDMEKGSGLVMCCTFGDQQDMEWQRQYNLPIKNAIARNGKMTSIAGKYEGLDVTAARSEIIKDLKDSKLLVKQKEIMHSVNTHERCGTPIEFVHSKQWFIKYTDLKDDMLRWGEELNWHPAHMKNRYDNWVKGLSWDWLISRQIYFGIPFPIWYCKKCEHVIIASENELPVDPTIDKPKIGKCPKCGSTEFIPETDVMCTWATSSLTPTIVKEMFKGKKIYDKLKNNPMSLRPQGHDIITFWLFNTVVKSKIHYDMLPWTDCFINGWILDPSGKKMSKSKGNIVEPQVMIEKYSSDILRYMSANSKLGEDLAFPEKEMIAGKRFINKLWNASKFCIMHLDGYEPEEIKMEKIEMIDRWILSRLQRVIKSSTESFEAYEFSKAKSEAENFFWQDFCDFYLEIVKDRLYNEKRGEDARHSARYTLHKVLYSFLRLFSPFTPFITEEIYQMHFRESEGIKSIHNTRWPVFEENLIDYKAEKIGLVAMEAIAEVRKAKSEKNLSLKSPIKRIEIESEISEDEGAHIRQDLACATMAEEIVFRLGKDKEIIKTKVFL